MNSNHKLFDGYKIYGPYGRKDGRRHVIAYRSQSDRMTISYPRYLMMIHLGRYLRDEEDVHHINGDVTDNDLSNLKVINGIDHRVDHQQKYDVATVNCIECDQEFLLDPIQNRQFQSNQRNRNTAGPFCSKQCIGRYGKRIQSST